MNALTCAQCRDLGPEFALGVAAGDERAQVLSHLDGCAGCREYVRELTVLGDRVTALVPGVEPPLGFERRVLDRSPVTGTPRGRWRAGVAAAAAAATLAGGWAIGTVTAPGESSPGVQVPSSPGHGVLSAALSGAHGRVGEVHLYRGPDPWIGMALDLDRPVTARVSCELVRRDGGTVPAGSFRVESGHGYWAGPVQVDGGSLGGARVVGPDGRVLAHGSFRR